MKNDTKGNIQKFAEFTHDASLDSLYSSPESLKRFDEGLSSLLRKADAAQAHSWITKARDEMSSFAGQIKESVTSKFSGLTRTQLLAELKNKMDSGLVFQHQFRNKKAEDLSDEELRSILDYQQLLKLLNQKKGVPTDGSGEGNS